MFYTTPFFSVYFGDASDGLYQDQYHTLTGSKELSTYQPYARLCQRFSTPHITFCHQIHSNQGFVATLSPDQIVSPLPFTMYGDFLLTNQSIALGVMAADCLPIVIHDTKTDAVGIVHAGWRGTVSHVVVKAVQTMQATYGSNITDFEFLFGPAAGACCYQVTEEFLTYLAQYSWHDKVIHTNNGFLFFDNAACNKCILQDIGVSAHAINTDFFQCTICSLNYCSFRREKEKAGRQMTVVFPHPR